MIGHGTLVGHYRLWLTISMIKNRNTIKLKVGTTCKPNILSFEPWWLPCDWDFESLKYFSLCLLSHFCCLFGPRYRKFYFLSPSNLFALLLKIVSSMHSFGWLCNRSLVFSLIDGLISVWYFTIFFLRNRVTSN